MHNPFEILKVDPTTPIREITEICLELSEDANEEERRKIRDALAQLRDEKKRLIYAIFTHHNTETYDSDWDRFVQKFRRLPFKISKILPKNVTEKDIQDIDWNVIESRFLQTELDEGGISSDQLAQLGANVDFEDMTIQFLEENYSK